MKKAILLLMTLALITHKGIAQKFEVYGDIFNIGLGTGYYRYLDNSIPVMNLNYRLDLERHFSLAPHITFFRLRENGFHLRSILSGVKETCYFDQIFNLDSRRDFYEERSLGFQISRLPRKAGIP